MKPSANHLTQRHGEEIYSIPGISEYGITKTGRILRQPRYNVGKNGTRYLGAKWMKILERNGAHDVVYLTTNGKRISYRIDHLMATTFMKGFSPERHTIEFRDGNRKNLKLHNLRMHLITEPNGAKPAKNEQEEKEIIPRKKIHTTKVPEHRQLIDMPTFSKMVGVTGPNVSIYIRKHKIPVLKHGHQYLLTMPEATYWAQYIKTKHPQMASKQNSNTKDDGTKKALNALQKQFNKLHADLYGNT